MQYPNITKATFCSRENRFVATVSLDGREEKVHVKNTGRCRELLVPGATVYLVHSEAETRKYAYDLVAVEKEHLLINMDSQAPNQVFRSWLTDGNLKKEITFVKPEYQYGNSRIDFYFECGQERHLVEVKGVTLEQDGLCRFPDAPTERGVKHLEELIHAVQEGYQAWICFVVQMDGMTLFRPNWETDPKFAKTLQAASEAGVQIRALGCCVTPDSMQICYEIPVDLSAGRKEAEQ